MIVFTLIAAGIFIASILILIAMGILPKLWKHKIIKRNSTIDDIIDSLDYSYVIHVTAFISGLISIILLLVVMLTTTEVARYDARDYDVAALAKEFVQKAKDDDNYSVVFHRLDGDQYSYIVINKYIWREGYVISLFGLNTAQLTDEFADLADQYKKEE